MTVVNKGFHFRKLSKLERKENIAAYLFLLPWLIGVLVFLIIPLAMSLYAAFTRWTIIDPPPRWIGLENSAICSPKTSIFCFLWASPLSTC